MGRELVESRLQVEQGVGDENIVGNGDEVERLELWCDEDEGAIRMMERLVGLFGDGDLGLK